MRKHERQIAFPDTDKVSASTGSAVRYGPDEASSGWLCGLPEADFTEGKYRDALGGEFAFNLGGDGGRRFILVVGGVGA